MSHFTIEEGLQIQSEDLKNWKAILKPEIYEQLTIQVSSYMNKHIIETGYDVIRGQEINNIVLNLMPQYNSKFSKQFPTILL